jgi:hypothetical protein
MLISVYLAEMGPPKVQCRGHKQLGAFMDDACDWLPRGDHPPWQSLVTAKDTNWQTTPLLDISPT